MINPELIQYIKEELTRGISKEEILHILISQGWQKEDVEKAFDFLSGKSKSKLRGPSLRFFIVGLLIIVGIAGIVFLTYNYSAKQKKTASLPEENKKLTGYKNLNEQNTYFSFSYPGGWSYLKFDDGKTYYLLTDGDLNKFLQQAQEGGEVELVREHLGQASYENAAIIRLSVVDVEYKDPKALLENYANGGNVVGYDHNAKISFETAKINGEDFQHIKYDTPIPAEMKPYMDELRKNAQEKGLPENVYMGEYDVFAFPQYRLYYKQIGKYWFVGSLTSLDVSKYEKILENICSTIKIEEPKIVWWEYNQNGLYFKYPNDWKIEEEWTGRNDNLGMIEIFSKPTKYESTLENRVIINIRYVGKTESGHQIDPKWNFTEETINGHKGKRYQYLGDKMYTGTVYQEHVVVQLDSKYEIDIYNENSEINKYNLDEIIKSIKINLAQLDESITEALKISPYIKH